MFAELGADCVKNYWFSVAEGATWKENGTSLLLWLVNGLVLSFCMIKMFVYGDPVLPTRSKESQNFWKYRKQADVYLLKVISDILDVIVC